MKIALIAPGEIEIPPKGWGALETVVWNQYSQLQQLGHEVKIINNADTNQTYQEVINFSPEIAHLHYGKHYEILPHLTCKKIITNHDGSFLSSANFHETIIRSFMYDCTFFILTEWEKALLSKIGFSKHNIFILPNGVDNGLFKTKDKPEINKSICLGKIDQRKNQAYLQKLNIEICFAGQNADPNFNPIDPNYLGIWTRDDVYNNLTNYVNLVLLSNSELQPLVCLEAMSAGLGLVISETAAQNLDGSKDFITIIPNSQIKNKEYVKAAIIDNQKICQSIDRKIIKEYAQTFDWSNIINIYLSYL